MAHDYLYWTQTRSREEADDILKMAMEDFEVGALTVGTIYRAVRVGGQMAWNGNAEKRPKGRGASSHAYLRTSARGGTTGNSARGCSRRKSVGCSSDGDDPYVWVRHGTNNVASERTERTPRRPMDGDDGGPVSLDMGCR